MMSYSDFSELTTIIAKFHEDNFGKLIIKSNIKTYEELVSLWTDYHEAHIKAVDSVLQKYTDSFVSEYTTLNIEKIEAQKVVVEVIDNDTGKLFRRTLPLKYLETDNGIIISGETIDGIPSNIALLSDTALQRINDLTGKGPDTHRCKD